MKAFHRSFDDRDADMRKQQLVGRTLVKDFIELEGRGLSALGICECNIIARDLPRFSLPKA